MFFMRNSILERQKSPRNENWSESCGWESQKYIFFVPNQAETATNFFGVILSGHSHFEFCEAKSFIFLGKWYFFTTKIVLPLVR